jgi:hypothetical protein
MPSQAPTYRKTVPEILLDLFRDNFKNGPFKEFREGDPIIFPRSMLPALFISENKTHYDQGPTGHDEISHEVIIQVVYDKRTEFGAPDGIATLDRTIELIMQGRDSVTGELLPSSILGILRKNLSVGSLMIDQIGDVDKGIVPRSEDLDTAEGQVRLTLTEIQSVSDRS